MAGQAWEFIRERMETNLHFLTRANCVRVYQTEKTCSKLSFVTFLVSVQEGSCL